VDLYDFPQGYRGLVLNEHRTSGGALDMTKEKDTIRVDRFDFSRLQQRDQREPLNILTGGDLGDASATFRYLSIAGMIRAQTGMLLSDKIAQLLQAFNIEESLAAFPTTDGQSPFTFTDVTLVNNGRGTAYTDPSNGTSGFYVLEKFLCRPAGFPIITQRRSGGDSAAFAVELICSDPRRYCNTPEAVVLNSGNGYSATCPNWNSLTGWAAPFVATIVTSASGSAAFSLNVTGDGVNALVLDLSAVGAATLTFDSATGLIKIASTHHAELRTSPLATLFARIPRGGNTAVATNTTNITSVTIAYSQARG
jgi:hypothetical protein